MNSTRLAKKSKAGWVFGLGIVVCCVAVIIGYFSSVETASGISAFLRAITSGSFVALTIVLILRSKNKQNFVFASLLSGFSILWFVAELIWTYYNRILHVESSITPADPVWLVGYVVLFVYLMVVIWPVRKFISTKILFSAVILSVSYLIPSFIELSNTDFLNNYEIIINSLYPIADAVLLVPLILGISLFQKEGRYFLQPLLIGLLINIATDTLYLFAEIGNSYYFGNPLELGFVVAYIVMAYGAYKQYLFMSVTTIPIVEHLKSTVARHPDNAIVFSSMSLIISTAVLVVALSLVQIYQLENLSTKEIMIFQPVVYGSIVAILALCTMIVVIGKKFTTLKSKMAKMQPAEIPQPVEQMPDSSSEVSTHLILMQKKLTSMEKTGAKTTYVLLLVSGIVVAALLFYMSNNVYPQNVDLVSGRFTIEDLNGQKINTWVTWNLISGESLHVSIINSNLLSDEKIMAIKSGILSEETVTISNSKLGKNLLEEKNLYYKGWGGALQAASMQHTSIYIPKDFEVEESATPIGEIWIILSKDHLMSGELGNTRSIVDADNHQILKSIITIYDVESLNNEELAAVTRHEFGHALGLYSSETNDYFLYHSSNSHVAYISQCNIDDLVSLYNENQPAQTACK
ncbi:MAG: hypothetical protein EPO62_07520 [Candidatus Nitrosotenuis sp.]|nr:MAG: hypothetical protein EPO62_07520 [Candidatus Nitrosotenuis sp.]